MKSAFTRIKMDQLDEILNIASGQIWKIFNKDTVCRIGHASCSYHYYRVYINLVQVHW